MRGRENRSEEEEDEEVKRHKVKTLEMNRKGEPSKDERKIQGRTLLFRTHIHSLKQEVASKGRRRRRRKEKKTKQNKEVRQL